MELYRISREKYVRDISGEGARLFGGRWNRKGVPLLYTSQSISLAALEVLVHTSISNIPTDLQLLVLEIPDEVNINGIFVEDLPENWQQYPAPEEVVEIGNEWCTSGKAVGLQVPSVIIPQEYNMVLNPVHADFTHINIKEVRDFWIDERIVV